jgi:hypothetical protein
MASARLARLADDLGLDVKPDRLTDWMRVKGGYDAAVTYLHDVAAVTAALRRRGLPCEVANASKRLRWTDAATIVALLDAGETNIGLSRQLQIEAERQGFTLHDQTARAWIRTLGEDGTRQRIADIGALLAHGERCGLGLSQQQAIKQLEHSGYDLARAIERVDAHAAEHRWLAERQQQSCIHRGRAADHNERAACACRGCFTGLYIGLEHYGRVVVRDHNARLVERFGVDELYADHAIPALCHAVYLWQHGHADEGRGSFAAFYGGVVKNALRDVVKHYARLRRAEIPRSLDEPLVEDGVALAERIPDRTIDVARIVVARERLREALAAARERCEGAVAGYHATAEAA